MMSSQEDGGDSPTSVAASLRERPLRLSDAASKGSGEKGFSVGDPSLEPLVTTKKPSVAIKDGNCVVNCTDGTPFLLNAVSLIRVN